MSYLACTRSQLSFPSLHHSVPLSIFPFHAFTQRKSLLPLQIRLWITFLVPRVRVSWSLYLVSNSRPGASVWDTLLFSYTTKVVLLGNNAESLDIGDLPIVPGSLRATYLFRYMRSALSTIRLRRLIFWDIRPGSGWELAYRLAYVNRKSFTAQIALASIGAVLYYGPPFFLQKLVRYLETDPERHDRSWGWFFSFGIFVTTAFLHLRKVLPSFDRSWD